MTNQSFSKRKSVNKVYASTSKDPKPQRKWEEGCPSHYSTTLPMEIGELLGPQQSFAVEYAQDIMQQQSDNLDCGMYVADFAEYLSDEINIPSISFRSDYFSQQIRNTVMKLWYVLSQGWIYWR
ncbi:hypothetical protein EJD97_002817 [Solanum chilense]|uniref:Ubiquitin-like protease family profile domain-containing protein n=1 Tax=Solanum chilense TaxID=4083 RepID=A0A6N2C2K5_SOLCI|nr:hypothetical protein EJD97_002817 [Solanum chilense]